MKIDERAHPRRDSGKRDSIRTPQPPGGDF